MQEQLKKMLESHPKKQTNIVNELPEKVIEIAGCALICNMCADACLGEQNVQNLADCIRHNLDCADICSSTAAIVSRQTNSSKELIKAQLQSCKTACKTCGDECQKHAPDA